MCTLHRPINKQPTLLYIRCSIWVTFILSSLRNSSYSLRSSWVCLPISIRASCIWRSQFWIWFITDPLRSSHLLVFTYYWNTLIYKHSSGVGQSVSSSGIFFPQTSISVFPAKYFFTLVLMCKKTFHADDSITGKAWAKFLSPLKVAHL